MIKFILNKIGTMFILFGGFASMYDSIFANIIYGIWIGVAGTWALLNFLALIESFRKNAKRQHLKALKLSNFQLYNAERAIALTLLAILCFLIEEQVVMGAVYLITTLPYTFILYKYAKVLEQKRQKRYNK